MEKLLPLLFLLACPLMMIFMMKGMHGGGGHTHESGQAPKPKDQSENERRIAELEQQVADLRHAAPHERGEDAERSR
jgi:hypothetical protein